MKITDIKVVDEVCKAATNMYRLGWDERNGGNISVRLTDDEVRSVLACTDGKVLRRIPLSFSAPELVGQYYVVTGTGKYFKNVEDAPEINLGIIRIAEKEAELLWGYGDGGRFTSELPAHLMSHKVRQEVDPESRVVIHTHPTYTIAMNTVCPVDEKDFTHRLWQINTEAIVVFPDGVGMLPWMVCGTNEIGQATAEKMRSYRIVIWTNHGIYGAGKDIDETFGLIETVEKTAQIYMLTEGKTRLNLISDDDLKAIAAYFKVTPKAGILQ